jgi:hypothetical protein
LGEQAHFLVRDSRRENLRETAFHLVHAGNCGFAEVEKLSVAAADDGQEFLFQLRPACPTAFLSWILFRDTFDRHFTVYGIPVVHFIRADFVGFASRLFKRARLDQNLASAVLNKRQCCNESFHV